MKKIFLALSVFLFFASNCFAGLPSSEYSSDANTQLLLHMNGTDGSTTFTDSGSTVHTVTAVGNAQIDTAQSKFGGASGLFDGTGDYLSIPDHADWYFGSGDFTIDFWVMFNSTASSLGFAGHDNDGGNVSWEFYWHSTDGIKFRYSTDGTVLTTITRAWSPSINTWYHLAIIRSGSVGKIFVDGLQIGADIDFSTDSFYNSTMGCYIGCIYGNGTISFNGWIEEFRISKGIARWTSNFATDRRIIFAQ